MRFGDRVGNRGPCRRLLQGNTGSITRRAQMRSPKGGWAATPGECLETATQLCLSIGVADLSGDWLFRSERKDTENSTTEEGGYPAFAGRVKRNRRFLPRP